MRHFNNTWITSDTHFFHHRIIEYENRPFLNREMMNEKLIKNWNKKVGKEDLVYHLGDLYMNASRKDITDLLGKLNGHIILISGNHDEDNFNFLRGSGRFLEVVPHPNKYLIENFIILSHEPVYLENRSPFINFFGHVHGSEAYKTISSHGACVCPERWDYTPVNFEYLKEEVLKLTQW